MSESTNKLKKITEFWCSQSYKKTMFFNTLKEEKLSKLQAAQFHYNAEIVIQNTLESMKEAGKSSEMLGEEDLSDFFKMKVVEETGHDKWAKEDYLKLGLTTDEKLQLSLSSGALKLINKLHQMARFSPFSMLAYVFFGEYHYTIIGPEVAELYESSVKTSSSLVHSHGVLDVEHVKEDIKAIDKLMPDGDTFKKAQQDLIECMNYQIEFYNEVCKIIVSKEDIKNEKRISA